MKYFIAAACLWFGAYATALVIESEAGIPFAFGALFGALWITILVHLDQRT